MLTLPPQEQLHFRKWLRQRNVADAFMLVPQENDAECEVCGTLPYFATVRCACNASLVACPQHGASSIASQLVDDRCFLTALPETGLAMCECSAARKTLELHVSDEELRAALVACGHSADSPGASPANKQVKRPRLEPLAAASAGDDAPRAADPESKSLRCSECGRHAGRGGFMRCMACDTAFHRKCADRDLRRTDVCLCPPCWDAQQ